jgi:crotonobetainyl-CoA:carnitine CoA-transferase CaiB-like acyl-CoA transferase
VPVAAFTFAHDGPRIDTPPPAVGQHNEEIFAELGVGTLAPKSREEKPAPVE